MPSPRRRILQVSLPILLLAAAGFTSYRLANSLAPPETRIPEPVVPVVRMSTIELHDLVLTVQSQGTVQPRTQTVLVAEVSGRVVYASPSFASGGFFKTGERILQLDDTDYREALVRAESAVAQATLRLERERAEADLARSEWAELGRGVEPPPLTSRTLQVAEAEAALQVAIAATERAKRDLDRTEIRAPYPALVREKLSDLGQFVSRGQTLGVIYAVDYAEVRLPLADDQLAFLDLPLAYRDGTGGSSGPSVRLTADFAGATHQWDARIVRTEGEIDPRTRLVHAVSRVADPYARNVPGRPPLSTGMFVQATIEGREVSQVAVIPRSALRDDRRVLVIDADDRLRFRPVEVLRMQGDEVIVGSGLNDGERICVSPLVAVTDGMKVRPEPS